MQPALGAQRVKTYHLPDLENVVLRDRADDPRFTGVPRKVGDLCRVSTVDEEELWWPILGILSVLFLTNLAEVPDVQTTVGARGGENGLVMGRPLDLQT